MQKMNHILETDRLFLREWNIKDSENLYQLNLNPNVVKYTGDKAFESIAEAENFLANYKDYEINGFGRWAVNDKSNGEFLGWCGLKYVKELNETDIGFRFFEEHWNKGFATESAKACLKYGFENLNLKTIIGRAMAENVASQKVLEKIGMNYEREFNFDEHKGLIYRIKNNQIFI
jgi:ribosomal-protein-alanine N-acetyltransferase